MNLKKELGEKIKRLRKNKGLTQEKLAELIEISPRNLSGIELGINYPKAETLEKIMIALDTTSEELFSNDYIYDNSILIKYIKESLKFIEKDRMKLEFLYKIVRFIKNF